jgi:hypothetical protein
MGKYLVTTSSNADEALRVRVETAQRVSGEVARHWDDRAVMYPTTHNLLSYAGVRCRVLGTYYMVNTGSDAAPDFRLFFGSDLSNYYPNRGLKVFKPRGSVLEAIVNFRSPGWRFPRKVVMSPSGKFATLRAIVPSKRSTVCPCRSLRLTCWARRPRSLA